MEIRAETPDDHGLVGLLYRQIYVGNYEAELVDELRAAGVASIVLVATQENELIGHILFADAVVEVDSRPVRALVLAEMGVHAEQQGAGVGARLVTSGLEAARACEIEAVMVLGHPNYYPRFGFSAERARHLRTPFRGGDAFMALELREGSLAGAAGRVIYPDAFHLGMPR